MQPSRIKLCTALARRPEFIARLGVVSENCGTDSSGNRHAASASADR
jgi:hypothetical protein